MSNFEQKLNDAIWVGKVLFDRNKATGSSANLSFMHEDKIYITASGTCFGNLTESSFSVVDLNGNHISGIKPSKELPLHMALYEKDSRIKSVLHTHSFYSTLWSCLEHDNVTDVIPNYTPYLRMKLGTVGLVPYAKPGSEELFSLFKERVNDSDGYLLQNHGPIVGDQDLISAFYVLEELEESARIAWELRNEKALLINS
ncbi:class II aldolase/adducin family protein [Ornithinibacillus bavariensis]|uniref:Class II aldolase n=1 Tax=Ornithinibacillus bavariensis TaxID=545502 RepID=A0A919XAL5_9BACI|nr:class II aldolase/adducin family protein [Ornithinibacillus bavariensis]GIO28109.1 class II aldolase [Ornithinibacillus bavariensis]